MTSGTDPFPPDRSLSRAYRAHLAGRPPGDHPGEDAWEAFASGTMDGDARRRFADHVVSCAACREVHDAVRALMEGAPAIDPGALAAGAAASGPGTWQRRAPALALAAGVVLAVAAATFYLSGTRDDAVGTVAGPAPSVEAAPRAVAPEPVAPSSRLALVKPDVQLPADLVVTTRGVAGADARRFLERFGEAIAPYREGNFDEAAVRLTRLAASDGDVHDVWFYLGVSQLFAGRPAEALRAFDRPGLADAIGDDLLWQRAVALERLGREDELDVVLRSLCGREGPYREQACAAAMAP